jgi:hypothetical protein
MVGAQLDGYDCMVKLSDEAKFMILEGDEYLSSPIDRRPKFHLYRPNIALISGIAWDHINVFPTFENYVEQFEIFCNLIDSTGTLIYNSEDKEVRKLGENYTKKLKAISYKTPDFKPTDFGTSLSFEGKEYPLSIFGPHNLQNLIGALRLGEAIGINAENFLNAMCDFKGAGRRLQKVAEKENFVMFKDFAHSPSKLLATTNAIKVHSTILEIGGETDLEKGLQVAIDAKDSIGGIVDCTASNLPVGLGEHFFDSVESMLSHAVFSIPAVRGIEFGTGFAAAKMFGVNHNDAILDASGKTSTNHAGGIVGGITNGNDLYFKIAIKPTASTPKEQQSWNWERNIVEPFSVKGRHDLCIALRVPVVLEAVTSMVLVDLMLRAQQIPLIIKD